ncbi:hypothetical protein B296_00058039 [Ensete ventricosum]|uniref:Uncharacterized protein n=1 Tax=Ensete ventricosum TaxID=4639 RepID=A0A426XNQ7_ENSVE|nr:hypothetical protein B296_00058039 [Ensete ventricosum]
MILRPRATDRAGNRGRATYVKYFSPSSSSPSSSYPPSFSLNRPPMAEIDHRRSILTVPSSSGQSAYWSAGGPVRTTRYRALPLVRKHAFYHKKDHHEETVVDVALLEQSPASRPNQLVLENPHGRDSQIERNNHDDTYKSFKI